MSNITKTDLLKIAAKEIKDICISSDGKCLSCPLSNKWLYEDEDRNSQWEARCPFDSHLPSKWSV